MIDKTVLVTGANKGIGLEIVRQLAGKGCTVFLTARNREKGQHSAHTLNNQGLNVHFIPMDVTNTMSISNAVTLIRKETDHLDVLVNNAGIQLDHTDILKMPPEMLQETLETNAYGPIRVIQQFLPWMKKGSRIINVSSELGALHQMGSYAPAYSISKTTLNAITRQFAAALKDRGIAVNTMHPGWVRTDMGGSSAPRSVEKGAETAVWLAMEAPQSLTGQFIMDKKQIDW